MTTKLTETAELELIAKIVEAVPDVLAQYQHGAFGLPPFTRPITLEDVLRALQELAHERLNFLPKFKRRKVIRVYGDGLIAWKENHAGLNKQKCQWELGKPLSEQSVETKAFLHSLLCA